MINFSINPAFVNDLYQKVGLDFADIAAKQVAQQQVETQKQILAPSLTPILVSYKSVERWNGILPQVSGGAVPFIELGKTPGLSGTARLDKN